MWRSFFSQFFASELVTSDVQLRQTFIWILAFLLTPGLFLIIQLFPQFRSLAIRARVLNAPELMDPLLAAMALIFVTYSMVTAGLIAVFAWDALVFDRRDAMVLGPLPLRGRTIAAAKLGALAALVLGASGTINVMTAAPYALATADDGSGVALVRHFAAHLTATLFAALFVFASLVLIHGILALAGGARIAARVGSLLQALFVGGLLSVSILLPGISGRLGSAALASADVGWIPTFWFFGLFEHLRGSDSPGLPALAGRAWLATPLVVSAAVVVSIAGVRQQLQAALSPRASASPTGSARLSRWIARTIAGRQGVARATADFMLLTITRRGAQQTPVAVNAAIGLAFIAAGLSRVDEIASLMRPSTAVLWVPLVMAYWLTIGLRAACFVPAELPASWAFRSHGPEAGAAYWSAVRSAMLAYVLPRTLLIVAVVVAPLVGWRAGLFHAAYTAGLVILLVEITALTLAHVPFTRPYEPGHARLRTRWPLYALAFSAFAYWPVRFELRILGNLPWLLGTLGCIAIVVVVIEIIGRRRAAHWPVELPAEDDPPYETVTTMGLTFRSTMGNTR